MNDSHPQQPSQSAKPKRPSRAKKLKGEITFIEVPRSPDSSFNRDRPANALILAQLEHLHQAEKNRLPRHKLSGIHPGQIRTEGEAAAYIQQITKLLHPGGQKKKKRSTSPKGA